MNTIKLTESASGKLVSINTDKVQYVRSTTTFLGEPRTEVVLQGATVIVKETLDQVEGLLSESKDPDLRLLEEETSGYYKES
jgi:hypothetical protein